MDKPKSHVFFSAYFLYFFSFWMVLAYLPLLFQSYGFSNGEIGFAIGLNSLASILLVIPFGVFSDYSSPKRILRLGAILYASSFLLLIFVDNLGTVSAAMILGGVGAATIRVVVMSLYLKLVDERERGRKVAFIHMGAYVGFALGPLLGGYLYENFGSVVLIRTAFVLSATIIGLTFVVQDAPPVVFSFKGYKSDIRKPEALFLMAVVLFLGTHFGTEQASISLLMQETIGLKKTEIGLVFLVLGLWMAVLVPFAGIVMDKGHRFFLFLLAGLMVSSFFQMMTAWAYSLLSIMIIRVLHTAGDTLAILEADVLTARFFPASRLGGNSGVVFCVRTVAIFLFAALSGWISERWGYEMPFLVNGIMVFAFSLIAFMYLKKLRPPIS
jgi:MFS family permease